MVPKWCKGSYLMQTFHLFLHIYAKWFRSYKYGEKLLIILHLFAQLPSQLTCACSKLTIELLKKGVKYVQS